MQKIILRPRIIYAVLSGLPFLLVALAGIFMSKNILKYGEYIYILSFLLVLIGFYQMLLVYSKKYMISEEKIIFQRGVFSITTDHLELYRVKDLTQKRSFALRLIQAMNVELYTSDKTHEILSIKGIPKSDIADKLSKLVETNRRARGVREFD